MPQRRSLTYLLAIIAVIVLPSALSLLWYQVSRDPNLRPLGITEQALRAYEGVGEGVEIVAVVEGDGSRRQVGESLRRAFQAKGVSVRLVLREGGAGTRVTYFVGKTTLGPYPSSRASEGIAAAVEAFHMY